VGRVSASKTAVIAATGLVVAGIGVVAATTIGNTDTAVSTDATTLVMMRDATPQPLPPYGAKVTLKGCGQVASVTVHVATKGVVFVSGDAPHWWTKTTTPTGTLAPPVLKGKMQPGVWIVFSEFPRPATWSVYYASEACRGTTLPYRWDASRVNVKVIP